MARRMKSTLPGKAFFVFTAVTAVCGLVLSACGPTGSPFQGSGTHTPPASASVVSQRSSGTGGTWSPTALQFATSSTGFAAGTLQGKGVVFRTTDAGASWTSILSIPAAQEVALDVISAQSLFVGAQSAGGSARVWSTSDGGHAWTNAALPGTKQSPCTIGLWLEFLDASNGWAACANFQGGPQQIGGVFGTANGGTTWTALADNFQPSNPVGTYPSQGLLGDLTMLDRTHGWFQSNEFGCLGGPLSTSNGGQTWAVQRVLPQLTSGQSCVFAAPRFFGTDGVMTATTHLGNLILTTSDSGTQWQVVAHYPSSTSMAPLFTGPNTAWTYDANSATAYSTTTGGASWQSQSLKGWPRSVSQVCFLNSTEAWVLEKVLANGQPVVLRSTDGGAVWTAP